MLYTKDGAISWATRVWWLFASQGWKGDVSILDGGFEHWVKAGGIVEEGVAKAIKRKKGTEGFQASQSPFLFATKEDVKKVVEGEDGLLVSSVTPEMFAGTSKEYLGAKGHIPTSLNLHYKHLLRSDGKFRSKDEIFDILERYHLLQPDTKKFLYCGAGIGATTLCFAISHVLENFPLHQKPDYAVYNGSMQEWGTLYAEEVEGGEVRLRDVCIVGGGPAGLSAAMTLGRSGRTVTLLDDGKQRNRSAGQAHNIIILDGTPPLEIIRQAREQLSKTYGAFVQFHDARVKTLRSERGVFVLTLEGEQNLKLVCNKVVFASGMADQLDYGIPGLRELWGDLIAHCPYCHGYEVRNDAIGLLLSGNINVFHHAMLLRNLSVDLTLFANGNLDIVPAETVTLLKDLGVKLIYKKIEKLDEANVKGKKILVVKLQDEDVQLGGLFIVPGLRQQSGLAEAIGCKMNENGAVNVDMFQQTTVKGCYAAGDTTNPFGAVTVSMAQGMRAGAMTNAALIQDRIELLEPQHKALM